MLLGILRGRPYCFNHTSKKARRLIRGLNLAYSFDLVMSQFKNLTKSS